MGGPKHHAAALPWIKEAIREGRYSRTKHLFDRMTDRTVSLVDILCAIRSCSRAEPHGDPPRHDGTCWRLHGKDLDGRHLAIGIEAYLDEGSRWAVLCTVIKMERSR